MSLLKDAPRLSREMKEAQERLAQARFTGQAGGGQVSAVCNGKLELIETRIAPELFESGDREMIEDLVTAAVRDGLTQAREAAAKEMQDALGGLDLGAMMNMFGGGGGALP